MTAAEYGEIVASSQKAGISLSEFVKRACLGSRIPSREDHQARRELLKVNADLGRLGGLLKQALAGGSNKGQISSLLHRIDQIQKVLQERIREI